MVRTELTAVGKALRRPVAAVQKLVACRAKLPPTDSLALRKQLHALAETMTMTMTMTEVEISQGR